MTYEPADDYDYPADPPTQAEIDQFYADWPIDPPPTDDELDDMAERFGQGSETPF
jgi:hypothetical protein